MSKEARITLGITFVIVVLMLIVSGVVHDKKKKTEKDQNVYLKEEVCYGKQVYIKVVGMSVTENTETLDEDGDELSKYLLNLELSIRQDGNKEITLEPSCFKLKSVNLESKSKMEVFLSSLLKETLSAMASGALTGEINIIEETLSFSEEYYNESIENAKNSKAAFKPIKPSYCSFERIIPRDSSEPLIVNMSFPIKKEYTESKKVIVLTINAWNKWEQRIFLIERPSNQ